MTDSTPAVSEALVTMDRYMQWTGTDEYARAAYNAIRAHLSRMEEQLADARRDAERWREYFVIECAMRYMDAGMDREGAHDAASRDATIHANFMAKGDAAMSGGTGEGNAD